MKSQEKSTIRALNLDELKAQLAETEEKLFRLKFTHAVSPLKNGLQIRTLKRHKARLMTWIREKAGMPSSQSAQKQLMQKTV